MTEPSQSAASSAAWRSWTLDITPATSTYYYYGLLSKPDLLASTVADEIIPLTIGQFRSKHLYPTIL
jgi:hypothetical protein